MFELLAPVFFLKLQNCPQNKRNDHALHSFRLQTIGHNYLVQDLNPLQEVQQEQQNQLR